MLLAQSLYKSYKTKQVVCDVSLHVEHGEIVGLLGPNGAGKTTTFHSIVGLIEPSAGKVFLENIEITTLPMHQRARMGLGYLPQEPSVFRKLTVYENLLAIMQLVYRSQLSSEQMHKKVMDLLDEFELSNIKDSLGMYLSGGERRRTEVARALIPNPRYVLFDEPFAGVDPIAVHEIQKMIRLLKEKNIGILITDHNVRETLSICDRVYLIYQGKIFSSGTPNEVANNSEVKRVYLGESFAW